jgi:hypothetical protein
LLENYKKEKNSNKTNCTLDNGVLIFALAYAVIVTVGQLLCVDYEEKKRRQKQRSSLRQHLNRSNCDNEVVNTWEVATSEAEG